MLRRIAHPAWKSGHLLAGLVVLSLGATCGERRPDGAAESRSAALTVLTFEAETLARTASTTGSQVTSEAGASGGQYVQLSGTPAAGAWIEFTLPNVAAGTYDVKLLYKANFNRGTVQASVDGVNQGSPCDQYAATAAQQVACSLASKTLTAGNHTLRFTVTGKNASSAGFMMVIDQISLTASGGGGGTSVSFEAEALTRTASATGSQVTSEAGASGGQYVQLSGTPATGAWIEFTLPNVAAGAYAVKLLYKSNFNRGIVQASIDGVNQGSPCDQYAATAVQQAACSLASKTLTAGNHTIRFTVTGKNASSAGFMMVIDQISLTASGGGGATWVGTWSGAPQLTEPANLPPALLSNSTLRQVVHVSLGGSQLRVRFSNEFGNGAVTINAAHVAVCNAVPVNSTIDTTTDRALSFSGSASVTIAAGQAVWSDALNFALAPLSNLSVTVAFGGTPNNNVTGHPGSRTTSYQQSASGNVSAASMPSALTADHWYILSGVDVMAAAKATVVLGDSITDGRGSTTNGNDRWPDDLARRLRASSATSVATLNQGIGGNAVTGGSVGPTALSRFSRDVLGQSGVRWVIIFEGVNDIGADDLSAATVTGAYDTLIAQARAQGLRVYGATITPFGGNVTYNSPAHESVRQSVNTYIRSGKFDAFIDFDAAVRDTSNPPKLQAAFDSGDGLHLNPAGYQKLADTVNLALFVP